MNETSPESVDIAAAAFQLIADRGWRPLRLKEIAEAAELSPADMRRLYPCKASVLIACVRHIEARAAAAPPPFEADDTVRDRLFELLMQRLDLLADHRQAVSNILRDLPSDPVSVLGAAPDALRLMASILDQAGVSAAGPVGILRCKGLLAIWVATLAAWARDDSPDHARTMATLDAQLRRAEPFARMLSGGRFARGARPAEQDG